MRVVTETAGGLKSQRYPNHPQSVFAALPIRTLFSLSYVEAGTNWWFPDIYAVPDAVEVRAALQVGCYFFAFVRCIAQVPTGFIDFVFAQVFERRKL